MTGGRKRKNCPTKHKVKEKAKNLNTMSITYVANSILSLKRIDM